MFDEYLPLALLPLCTLAYYVYSKSQKPNLPLPPSPNSDPLIGHLRSLPSTDEHRVYRDMGITLKSQSSAISFYTYLIVLPRRYHLFERDGPGDRRPELSGSISRAPRQTILDLL